MGSKGHGTAGQKGKGQREGGGMDKWARRCPGEGIGMVERYSPASRPTYRPTIPTATLPGDGDDVPTPASVPGHAATGTPAAAPAGQWDSVGGAGREGRRAQEVMGEDRGSREEPEGERGQGHGWGGQGGGGEDGRDRQAARAGRHRQWRSCRRRGRTFGEGKRGWRGRNGGEDDMRREGGRRVAPH